MTRATGTSRPLRAAGVVLGGWVAVRIALLWSGTAPVPMSVDAIATKLPLAAVPALAPAAALAETAVFTTSAIATPPSASWRTDTPIISLARFAPPPPDQPQRTTLALSIVATAAASTAQPLLPILPFVPPPAGRNRFQLSAWTLLRDAATPGGLAPGGVLGGSQAGARLWVAPGPRGLVLTGRISTPIGSRTGGEASLGAGYRRGAFGVIVEERFALDRGGGARPSVTAFGGVSDIRLPGKFRLDGYAQAGIVGLRNRIGFADGALRIEHPLIGRAARLSVGGGAWGGVQPGLSRLDIGPQLVARLPVFGGALRIAGEWRFRVAGNADPGSGPVLSLGADF